MTISEKEATISQILDLWHLAALTNAADPFISEERGRRMWLEFQILVQDIPLSNGLMTERLQSFFQTDIKKFEDVNTARTYFRYFKFLPTNLKEVLDKPLYAVECALLKKWGDREALISCLSQLRRTKAYLPKYFSEKQTHELGALVNDLTLYSSDVDQIKILFDYWVGKNRQSEPYPQYLKAVVLRLTSQFSPAISQIENIFASNKALREADPMLFDLLHFELAVNYYYLQNFAKSEFYFSKINLFVPPLEVSALKLKILFSIDTSSDVRSGDELISKVRHPSEIDPTAVMELAAAQCLITNVNPAVKKVDCARNLKIFLRKLKNIGMRNKFAEDLHSAVVTLMKGKPSLQEFAVLENFVAKISTNLFEPNILAPLFRKIIELKKAALK